MEELDVYSSHSTFRDPAGSVEVRPDGVFRSVQKPYAADIIAFLKTPVSTKLVAEGRMVASEFLQPDVEDGSLHLRHPRVSFRSYPWEWSPSLWLSAAELTLDLCTELLADGWILKDATPLNVLFQGTKPIFVDLLSVERLDATRPLWLAYGQFVRTFLLPMVAHSRLGWPLHSMLMRRDGFEPEEIYSALSWWQRLQRPALSAVTLPRLLANSGSKIASEVASRKVDDPEITKAVIGKTLSKLRLDMKRAMPASRRSTWSDYTESASHYSADDHTAKQCFVGEALAACRPVRVLDIGCNTGVYSRLAADSGAEVVSIDTDISAVDRLCVDVAQSGKSILPLCVDLAHPTPSTGWENGETVSFLDRCCGHFDTVLMLAVIHHLLLSSQIPLGHIASLCSRVTTRNLIIEWVPPTDIKFIEVLRGREAIYTHIDEDAFREAFAQYFDTVRETTLRNGRILLHLERR